MNTKQKIALASALSSVVCSARALLGKTSRVECRRGGIRWELDLKEGIDFSIYLQGGFEPRTLSDYRRMVKPGFTVLDIGANIGAHTLPLAGMVGGEGTVHAFEPTDYAFAKQQRNIALNPELAPRIRSNQMMLVGKVAVEKPEAIPSSWPLTQGDGDLHPVHLGRYNTLAGARAIRLDDWAAETALERIDFVKIDVDGYEVDVLEGGSETFSRYRPRMMMEFAPYIFAERDRTFAELLAILRSLGYEAREVDGTPVPLEPSIAETRIPAGGSMNVILNAR